MVLEVDFREKEGYVHAEITGTFDKSKVFEIFENILVYLSEQEKTKILIDSRKMEGQIPFEFIAASTQRMDEIHTNFSKMMLTKFKFGAVVKEEEINQDSITESRKNVHHNFFQTVDHDEAVNWLLSE